MFKVGWLGCVVKCPVEQFLNRAKFDRWLLVNRSVRHKAHYWSKQNSIFYPALAQQPFLNISKHSKVHFVFEKWSMTSFLLFQKQCLHWLPNSGDWALSSWGTFGTVAGGTNRPWYNLTKTARALLLPSVWYLFDTPFLCWPDMNNIKVTLFYDFLGRERRPKWERS